MPSYWPISATLCSAHITYISLINTDLCIPTQKRIRQRNSNVKVNSFQDLLFHIEQFISGVCVITDIQKVVNHWRTSLL